MSIKRVIVQMTEDQVAWLDSQVRPMGSRASVIRELIDYARQGCSPELPGNGARSISVPIKSRASK